MITICLMWTLQQTFNFTPSLTNSIYGSDHRLKNKQNRNRVTK